MRRASSQKVDIPILEDNGSKIIAKLKVLIIIQCLLGVNRTYLFQIPKWTAFFIHIYCLTLLSLSIYNDVLVHRPGRTEAAFKAVFHLEHVMLYLSAITFSKKKLQKFFQNLNKFDAMLGIQEEFENLNSMKVTNMWLIFCVLCNCMQILLSGTRCSYLESYSATDFILVIKIMAHDVEQLLWMSLFRAVWWRLRAVRARSAALRPDHVCSEPPRPGPAHPGSPHLGPAVDSLHAAYQLLHKCFDYFNYIISVPMLIIFVTAGMATILMMYNTVRLFYSEVIFSTNLQYLVLFFFLFRITTFLVFVTIPCYYSSQTASEAYKIHSIACNILTSGKLDRREHRKLKVLLYLTRESCFSYTILSVVHLNLKLPLSFLSDCLTYTIIAVQFNKFTD